MKRILILVLIVLTAALNVRAAQDSKFFLSPNGRKAYEKLLNVRMFAVGPLGFGSQTSESEIDLAVLLTEKNATEALKSLVEVANPEGKLYGLLGLRFIDIDAFREEVENYKARPESLESRPSNKFTTIPKGEVMTASGCIIFLAQPLKKMVSAIETGDYDGDFNTTRCRRLNFPPKIPQSQSVASRPYIYTNLVFALHQPDANDPRMCSKTEQTSLKIPSCPFVDRFCLPGQPFD